MPQIFIDVRLTPCNFIPGSKAEKWFQSKSYDQDLFLECFLLYLKSLGFSCEKWLTCIEQHNKFGETEVNNENFKNHFHYTFIGPMNKSTLSFKQNINAWTAEKGFKGCPAKCIRWHGDLEDEARWRRYPLKSSHRLEFKEKSKHLRYYGYTEEEIEKMCIIAQSEYERTVKQNVINRQRLESKNLFWEKMCHQLLKAEKINAHLSRTCWIAIVNYYVSMGKDPPFLSLDDKVLHLQLRGKAITVEQLYDAFHKSSHG